MDDQLLHGCSQGLTLMPMAWHPSGGVWGPGVPKDGKSPAGTLGFAPGLPAAPPNSSVPDLSTRPPRERQLSRKGWAERFWPAWTVAWTLCAAYLVWGMVAKPGPMPAA